MPNPSLVKFRDYLTASPPKGSTAPPRTIKADDLDGNFRRCTVNKSQVQFNNSVNAGPLYDVQYTAEGTELIFSAGGRYVYWREIDICVDGVAKKMMVLGTEPY
jgi:hypothetical protein